MALAQDQLTQRVQLAKQQGWSDARIQNALRNTATQQPAAPAKKSNLLVQLAPLLGSIGGGLAGGLAGPAGVIAGGAAGGAAGERLRQRLSGEQTNIGNIVKEGAFGALGGLGEGIQALRGAGTAAKVAEGAIDAGRAVKGVGLAERGIAAVGKGATNAGESLAVKALRPSPSQLAGFAAKHGVDIAPVLQGEGLVGKSVEDIASHIAPIQSHFNSMIEQSGAKVNPNQLKQVFLEHMQPLLDSTDPADKAIAQKIQSNLDNILAKVEKDPSASTLNKIRQSYDSKVNYKLAAQDIASYGEKKTIADALRTAVQQSVDGAGVKGPLGENLKQLGSRLNKLYDISSIAETKAHLGRGSLPAGLLQTLAFGGGGAVAGGPLGGAVGVVAQGLINSPAGMRFGSKALTKLGGAVTDLAPKVGPTLGRAASIGGAQMGANAVFGNGQPQQPEPAQNLQSQYQMPQGQDQLQQFQQQPDQSQQQQQMFLMAMMDDMQRTGGKNLAKIQTIAQFADKMGGAGQKPLNTTAATQVSQFDNSLANLNEVESLVNQLGSSFGPVKGRLNSLNPYNETQANINQATLVAAQNIGRALEGGKLTDADIARYQKALPNINDTPQIAQGKINRLRKLIQQQRQNYIQNVSGSQSDSNSLISGLNGLLGS